MNQPRDEMEVGVEADFERDMVIISFGGRPYAIDAYASVALSRMLLEKYELIQLTHRLLERDQLRDYDVDWDDTIE